MATHTRHQAATPQSHDVTVDPGITNITPFQVIDDRHLDQALRAGLPDALAQSPAGLE